MKAVTSVFTLLACLIVGAASSRASDQLPYLDSHQPRDVRIRDLISRMSLEEKAAMMQNTTPGVPRLGIPRYNWWSEALHGVANAGVATVFPQAIGLAAMWDQPLQAEVGHVIGVEGRAKFNSYIGTPLEGQLFRGLTFWSPNINIFRDPRWGRGQETYGEDPFLTSRLGLAFVRGIQGDDPNYLLAAACAKHFAVHSGPESLRHGLNVNPPEADLYETYLPAFETLVRQGHVEAVMTAYNSLYGAPCSVSPLLYHKLADWGFDGHVTSDCGSVGDLRWSYKLAATDAEAEMLVLKAGLNVTCGGEAPGIVEAVHRGMLKESEVDERLTPLLRTMFRLGFFDPKEQVPFNKISPSQNNTDEHAALALRAAHESIVLLKNDGILPLDTSKYKKILVLGPNASSVPVLLGNYNGEPSAPITILNGIKAAFGSGVTIDYAHGCDYATRPDIESPIANTWFSGEYFNNRAWQGAPVKRTERPVNFDLSKGFLPFNHLPPGIAENGFSARWTANVPTKMAGSYKFIVRGRGGFRLTVGDSIIIDSLVAPAGKEDAERTVSIDRSLPENGSVPIKLEYVQGTGAGLISLQWKVPRGDTEVDEAVAKAKAADAIIFVGGISAELEGEEMQVSYDGFAGGDRTRIELPVLQKNVLQRLQALGKPIVFVSMSGSALAMPWANDHLNAIVQSFYPGQSGGSAVADVLLGKYNPAGRLPITFYRATEDLPPFTEYKMENRTYRYFSGKPLYPFGYGLSYSQFAYSNLQVAHAADHAVTVSVEVTNSAGPAGDEVVQIYATPPRDSHPREQQALCGFARVHLNQGEKKTVRIVVPPMALRRWSEDKKQYVFPSGDWVFHASASSADPRQTATVRL